MADYSYTVTANGDSSAYLWSGHGLVDSADPTLYFREGDSVTITNTSGGHAMRITPDSGDSVDETNGVLFFSSVVAGGYTYICTSHSAMTGRIEIGAAYINQGPQDGYGTGPLPPRNTRTTVNQIRTKINEIITKGGSANVSVEASSPDNPQEGDLWFDTTVSELYVYDEDLGWIQTNGGGSGANVTTSTTAPSDASEGDLWYDTSIAELYVYIDGIGWLQANPGGGSGGLSEIVYIDAFPFDSGNGFYTLDDLGLPSDTKNILINCQSGLIAASTHSYVNLAISQTGTTYNTRSFFNNYHSSTSQTYTTGEFLAPVITNSSGQVGIYIEWSGMGYVNVAGYTQGGSGSGSWGGGGTGGGGGAYDSGYLAIPDHTDSTDNYINIPITHNLGIKYPVGCMYLKHTDGHEQMISFQTDEWSVEMDTGATYIPIDENSGTVRIFENILAESPTQTGELNYTYIAANTDYQLRVILMGGSGGGGGSGLVDLAAQSCPSANTGTLTWAHGQSSTSFDVELILRCTTAEHGYSVGDEVQTTRDYTYNVGANTISVDATNITFSWMKVVGSSPFSIVHKSTPNQPAYPTAANWEVFPRLTASGGGGPRAYVSFDGTSSSLYTSITNSYNVSSITDGGTGIYTITFSNQVSNPVATAHAINPNTNVASDNHVHTRIFSVSSSAIVLRVNGTDSDGNLGTAHDPTYVSLVVH